MPIIWNLKKWLATERDIYRPSELQALLTEKAGIQLSLQAISSLINSTPGALRLQTVQALCNALDCKLSDFCEVLPDTISQQRKQRKAVGETPRRLYGGKSPRPERDQDEDIPFPNPRDYLPDDER